MRLWPVWGVGVITSNAHVRRSTLRFENIPPPCIRTKSTGGVSELVLGPYAALASSSEMLMYNTYTALSETFAALPTNQILPSDPPPKILTQPRVHGIGRRWLQVLKCSCTTRTLRFQKLSPPCLRTKYFLLTHPREF